MSRRTDVAVVGAGLAGLVAARRLVAAGLDVVVVAARDRVGGRTLNHTLPGGEVVEVGGQFAGPTQGHVLGLARELGVATFPANTAGDNVYVSRGKAKRYTGDIPPDLTALPDVGLAQLRINRLSRAVPVAAPWEAPRAAEWDRITLDTWLRRSGITDGAVDLVNVFLNSAFGGDARDTSLLFALWYVATFGDEDHPGTLDRGIAVEGGAQECRFEGGSQLLSIRMADELDGRVLLGAPVRRIDQDDHRVTVRTDAGDVVAGHAVVAVPPPLAARIAWDPLLPAPKDALYQRLPFGTLMKCEAVYPEPFWRDEGLNGTATFRDRSPICSMWDNTPPSGSPGVLMGFLGGAAWRTWAHRHPGDRRAAVLGAFSQAVGAPALRPDLYVEQDWTAEEWTRGGPTSVAGPGVVGDLGRWLRTEHGRVHFAGAETARYWNGFMDGAVRSGEDAAAAVLARR